MPLHRGLQHASYATDETKWLTRIYEVQRQLVSGMVVVTSTIGSGTDTMSPFILLFLNVIRVTDFKSLIMFRRLKSDRDEI